MLELRLRPLDDDRWFRYQLHPDYRFIEVEAYIEEQTRAQHPVRLMTKENRVMDFQPGTTSVVQLVCL